MQQLEADSTIWESGLFAQTVFTNTYFLYKMNKKPNKDNKIIVENKTSFI